ncbi:MAG: hypothetical protein KDA70_14735 [Planctomycetaceae bacterium]|nr:hypothetical protein [Planctomycetaceae bacterium]
MTKGFHIFFIIFVFSGCSSLLLSEKDRCLSELIEVCPNGLDTDLVYKKYIDQECFVEVIDELITSERIGTTDHHLAFYMLLTQLKYSPFNTSTPVWSWIKLDYEFQSIDCGIELNKRTFNAIQRGIKNNPEILDSLLYNLVQDDLVSGHGYSFQRNYLLFDYHNSYSDERRTKSSKFICLILIAALFGDSSIIEETSWENVEEKWRTKCNWLGQVAKFSVFDSRKKHFVVDQKALTTKTPVNTLKQIPDSHLNGMYQIKSKELLESLKEDKSE